MKNQDEESSQISPEEYEKRKKEMLEVYERETPFLLKQLEYEETIAKLEEARARYLRAQQMIANIKAGPPEHEPATRTLRKEQ